MSAIAIRRSHRLTHKQAVAVAKKMAAELEREYGIEATWSGADTVEVRGMGVNGTLHLAPHLFQLEIKLGLMLGMFRDRIRDEVEVRLDQLLASAPEKRKQGTKK